MASNSTESREFIKYSSITNTYQEKHVAFWLNKYPQLKTELFVMQHKYDGSNFQVIFSKTGERQYASRNCVLDSGDKFFGYKNILPKIADILDNVQKFLDGSEYTHVNLFGELYGTAVIKRIKYEPSSTLNVRFFDVYFDNKLLTVKEFDEWAKTVGLTEQYKVETFGAPALLEECLKFDTNSVKTKCDDIIEGIVIKPYSFNTSAEEATEVEDDGDDETAKVFYLKLKNAKYLEIENKKVDKTKTEKKEKPEPQMSAVESECDRYVNENRVLNSFGKQEWTKKDTPKFAEFVINDALEDFFKDLEAGKITDLADKVDLSQLKGLTLEKKAAKLGVPSKNTRVKLFQIIKTTVKFN